MLVQECLCWRWELFRCSAGIWGSCTSLVWKVMWQKWRCGLLCLNCLFDFRLRHALLSQERMFSLTFMPTNSPWDLTGILSSFRVLKPAVSILPCYAVGNTRKSARSPYYVLSCPDCPGLQGYQRSRLLLFFILFVLSKLSWWSQWIHITGIEQLGPSFFLLLMWIALGLLNLKTSFKW